MKVLYFFLLYLGLSACNLAVFDKPKPLIDPLANNNPVDLESPQTGQQSLFRCYVSSCNRYNEDFTFTNDTLLLKVFKDKGNLYFSESVTVNSSIFQAGLFTKPIIYQIWDEDGAIILSERKKSKLFRFFPNDTLDFKNGRSFDFVQDTCQLENPFMYIDFVVQGMVNRFQVGEIVLEDIGVMANFNRPRSFLFHDEKTLIMSHSLPNDGFIQGWVKIN